MAERWMGRPVSADVHLSPVLHLLEGPYVMACGDRLEIPDGSKRLLVFVALGRRRVERRHAAGVLWPMGDDSRAAGNLRSALWRLKCGGIELLSVDKSCMFLREDVVVDIHVTMDWAYRLIAGVEIPDDLEPHRSTDALNLLPGWYDEWVLMERERLRQRVLHGLEAQSRALVRAGRFAEAVETALTAVSAEPMRESAQRALLEAHLAEGNWIEARRAFEGYRHLLVEELGVEPSPKLAAVISPGPPGCVAAGRVTRTAQSTPVPL